MTEQDTPPVPPTPSIPPTTASPVTTASPPEPPSPPQPLGESGEPLNRQRTVLAALAAGLLAAAIVPGRSPAGLGVVLCTLVAAGPGAVAARRYDRVRGALAIVAAGLAVVPAISDSSWLVPVCGVAAFTLAIVAALDTRRWNGVAATLPIFGIAAVRGSVWAVSGLSAPRVEPAARRAWLRGLGVAAGIVPVVAALLASSDALFATFLRGVWVRPGWELLPVRALFFGLFAVLAVAGAYAAAHYRTSAEWAPDAQWPVPAKRVRHPAEWLLPLVLTSVLLAAFIAVQITALFGGDDLIRRETGLTYADRAHEGFGQLIAVTVLMAALLGWAGRIAAAGTSAHRRMLALAGGVLLTLTILLAVSALRRLWLYQSAYGWTIRRLLAGSFELWLAAMLLGLAVVWALRRTDLTPRLVLGSAGLGILCLALAGPDAIVVHADVIRYRSTGKWDMGYIAHLSADAVPALNALPEPMRTQALTAWQNEHRTELGAGAGEGDGWAAWSLSRWRACRLIVC